MQKYNYNKEQEAHMIKYLGVIGFCLFFIYDYNQVRWNNGVLKKFFLIGLILISIATIYYCTLPLKSILGIIIALFGLALTVYVLFFALDFKDTYINDKFKVYDKGVYSLCRHPGYWSLLIMYLGLLVAFQDVEWLWITIIYNLLNLIYIVFQDKYTFTIIFEDYCEYKTYIPFLIPTLASINSCLNYFRGKNEI